MTLNSLVAGCNQKTSRDPVIDVSEAEAQAAIDSLKGLTLVIESSGGRVQRFSHNIERVLQVPSQSTALLAVLMLRGPLTAGELRINSERMHKFADISAVEGFLHELAERQAGALVVELARQPGARENRWAHLLSGEPSLAGMDAAPAGSNDDVTLSEVAALKANLARVEADVGDLKVLISKLCLELGVSQ